MLRKQPSFAFLSGITAMVVSYLIVAALEGRGCVDEYGTCILLSPAVLLFWFPYFLVTWIIVGGIGLIFLRNKRTNTQSRLTPPLTRMVFNAPSTVAPHKIHNGWFGLIVFAIFTAVAAVLVGIIAIKTLRQIAHDHPDLGFMGWGLIGMWLGSVVLLYVWFDARHERLRDRLGHTLSNPKGNEVAVAYACVSAIIFALVWKLIIQQA